MPVVATVALPVHEREGGRPILGRARMAAACPKRKARQEDGIIRKQQQYRKMIRQPCRERVRRRCGFVVMTTKWRKGGVKGMIIL